MDGFVSETHDPTAMLDQQVLRLFELPAVP